MVSQAIERILRAGLAGAGEIQGCSPEEVRQVETSFALRLPAVYRDFLLEMGRGAGEFYQGSDMFFPDLLELREAAQELLASDSAGPLPDDAFVFLMHQGYQFLYFRVTEGDDPPVYYYREGEAGPEKRWPSFSAFLASSLDDYERAATT